MLREKKKHVLKILYFIKLFFKSKGVNKTFSDQKKKKKEREFIVGWPLQKKMVNVLQSEGK